MRGRWVIVDSSFVSYTALNNVDIMIYNSIDENRRAILLFLPDRLVSFPAVNAFVGPAEGTKFVFNFFDKPERGPFLFFAGLPAHGASHADLGHFTIPVRDFTFRGFYRRLSRGPFIFLCGCFSF